MSLVRVKRFAQVTLPPDVRKQFNLEEGDYLEAHAVKEGILLKPVAVVERTKAWKRLFAATEQVKPVTAKKATSRTGLKQEEKTIAKDVKAFRKHRRA